VPFLPFYIPRLKRLKIVVIGGGYAGIAALDMLQKRGVAAAAVAHTSGRIGDSMDMWENGVLSHVNAVGQAAGLAPGARVRTVLTQLVSR